MEFRELRRYSAADGRDVQEEESSSVDSVNAFGMRCPSLMRLFSHTQRILSSVRESPGL